MTFKEFDEWCNERACDGCWGMNEALICCRVCGIIHNQAKGLFKSKKREKLWNEYPDKEIVEEIVKQTNKKISDLLGDE